MPELSSAELECALNAAHTENAALVREIERLNKVVGALHSSIREWKPKSRKEMDCKNAAAVLLMEALAGHPGGSEVANG